MHKDQVFYEVIDNGVGAHGIHTGIIRAHFDPSFFGYEDLRYDFVGWRHVDIGIQLRQDEDYPYWFITNAEFEVSTFIESHMPKISKIVTDISRAFKASEHAARNKECSLDDQLVLGHWLGYKSYVQVTRNTTYEMALGYYFPKGYGPTKTGHKWMIWCYADKQKGRNKKPANYLDENGVPIVYIGFVYADDEATAFNRIMTRLNQYERNQDLAKAWIASGQPVTPKYLKWNKIKEIY